jgi:hypothetical protein
MLKRGETAILKQWLFSVISVEIELPDDTATALPLISRQIIINANETTNAAANFPENCSTL